MKRPKAKGTDRFAVDMHAHRLVYSDVLHGGIGVGASLESVTPERLLHLTAVPTRMEERLTMRRENALRTAEIHPDPVAANECRIRAEAYRCALEDLASIVDHVEAVPLPEWMKKLSPEAQRQLETLEAKGWIQVVVDDTSGEDCRAFRMTQKGRALAKPVDYGALVKELEIIN